MLFCCLFHTFLSDTRRIMTRYLVFLRAINVGGHTVKMEELKKLIAMPGFKNIASYIQSGNLAFDHAGTDPQALIDKIESKLLKSLGYEVKTFLKTRPGLESVINNNPFNDYPDDMVLHVSFLSGIPSPDVVKQMLALQNEFEQFRFIESEAYILVKKGAYGETKFSNTFLEKKLKLHATTRNWATINKMLQL